MTIHERTAAFINYMDRGEEPFLEKIYKEAKEESVPVIRRDMCAFLKTAALVVRPKRILEIGTAVGFSALLLASVTDDDCHITTIENYEKRITRAKKNLEASPWKNRITLLEGDAEEKLKECGPYYDLIFLDGAKGQYLSYLPVLKSFMKKGSVLICDNVMSGGETIWSKYLVERRDRTIHKRMREFLYTLKRDTELQTSVIPLGDGVTMSVKL